MVGTGAKWWCLVLVGLAVIGFADVSPALVSAEEIVSQTSSSDSGVLEMEPGYLMRLFNFFWQNGRLGYTKIWPDMEFSWKIVVGTLIGFFGAAFGSVGGVGGGGFFVPMLTLIIGFDQKSSTAISKCMITGGALATVFFNLRLRHPQLDMPLIDYDLALLFQPLLVLGISIGVAFNVIFADWMITVLLIIIFIATSTKAFFKGVETWKKETMIKKESAKRSQSDGSVREEIYFKPLPGGPNNGTTNAETKLEVSIAENVPGMELGLLVAVWIIVLGLEIAKNHTTTCSVLYWVLNLLQLPATLGVTSYEAINLYKGKRVIESRGEAGAMWPAHKLVLYCLIGMTAGIVGGLLGLGGGFILGPLFLELGIPPQVSSATATFAMTFSASMSVVEYYLLKRFPIPYALYFVAVATVSALVGQHVVRKLIAILGRASIIIFILAFTIFVSAISIGGVGIANMVEMIEEKKYMGFDNLCTYEA